MDVKVAHRPAREFFEQIADPDIFCGGGSVAALAAAGAGATALLVMRLNHRRRSNADRRDDIQGAVEQTEAAIDAFYAAADEDIEILGRLLDAHRAVRAGGSREPYLAALTNAADSPLRMGELIAGLLDTIDSQLAISTRFTVSDLGAAAVLAEGACRAALLTAEVNVALLAEAEGSNARTVDELQRRRATIRESVIERAERIEAITREMMLGEPPEEGSG